MKIKHIILFGVVAAFSSCSTAYRSGQTPDDVYYSPAPASEQASYVSTVNDQDKNSYSYRNDEETAIRRGIEDPVYRNTITFSMGMGGYSPYSLFPYNSFNNPLFGYDPYGYDSYGYDSYGYSPYGLKGMYNPYYNSYGYNGLGLYNPYSFYNYSPYSYGYSPYYNPYSPIFYSHGILNANTNTGARRYNLNAYNNTSGSSNSGARGNFQPTGVTPTGTSAPIRRSTIRTTAPVRSSTETAAPNTRSGVGNVIRKVFTPSERRTYVAPKNTRRTYNNNNTRDNNNTRTYNNNRSNTNQTPARTYTPSPSVSSPSSSGSRSSSSAPVRTFRR